MRKKRQGLQKKQTIENDLLLKCQRPRMQGPRSNFWIEGAECLASRGGEGAGATIESPFLLRSFSTFFRFLIF